MSAKWQTLNLEKCLEQVKYPNKVLRKEFLEKGKFPIISQEQEFINGYWDKETDIFYAKNYPVVIFGDHTKILKYVDFDFVLGADGVKILKPKDPIDPKYLYYFLNACPIKSLGYARHYRILKELDVRFPASLSEQRRIVAILDEAFEGIDKGIANTEKNLTNTRKLFESYLNRIFTQKGEEWEEKTLQQISIKLGRGKSKHRPRGDNKLYGGEYPLIQTGDVSNSNHRITSYSQTYNDFGLAQSELWPSGTVCIAIVGANVAETSILDFDACFPDSVIGIIVNDKYANNDYVEYLLQSFKAELKEKGKGTARDNINLGTFANQKFPFPSMKTQKMIVSSLEELSFEIESLEAIYRQKLAALNELKQAILQKAFTGELTAGTASQAIEAAEEDRPISKDCLPSAEAVKQNDQQSAQLSLWA
jgi:type I restriction enzyme, S subunit